MKNQNSYLHTHTQTHSPGACPRRDPTLLRGNLNTFTISFWNPDMRTPYCFHGAEFSFSLNFVSSLP